MRIYSEYFYKPTNPQYVLIRILSYGTKLGVIIKTRIILRKIIEFANISLNFFLLSYFYLNEEYHV